MSRLFLSISTVVLLAGCAHVTPQHLVTPKPHVTAPIVKPAAPVIATTPNAIVKKRWYSRFPHHPKFFH